MGNTNIHVQLGCNWFVNGLFVYTIKSFYCILKKFLVRFVDLVVRFCGIWRRSIHLPIYVIHFPATLREHFDNFGLLPTFGPVFSSLPSFNVHAKFFSVKIQKNYICLAVGFYGCLTPERISEFSNEEISYCFANRLYGYIHAKNVEVILISKSILIAIRIIFFMILIFDLNCDWNQF